MLSKLNSSRWPRPYCTQPEHQWCVSYKPNASEKTLALLWYHPRVHSNIFCCCTGPVFPTEHSCCYCWRAVLFLERPSLSWTTPRWDFWVSKEAMSEKIFIYILVFLLVLGRDYWTVKRSFQKLKAQKERSSRKLSIHQLRVRTFTQAGTVWDSHQLFQNTANRCLGCFYFHSQKKHTVPRQKTVLFQLTVFVLSVSDYRIIDLFSPRQCWNLNRRGKGFLYSFQALSIFLGQWGWETKV